MNIHCYSEFRVASHADVLRGSSHVPAPLTSGAGTHDEPLPLAKQSTGYAFTNGYKNFLNESGDECCKSSSRLSRKSFVRFNNGAKLFERMLIIDLFTVYDAILAGANTAKITVNVSMGFWPTWNRYNAATKRRISNICHYTLNNFIDIIH